MALKMSMRVRFDAAITPPRWAWTVGLAALDQTEIAVPLQWPENRDHDRQVVRLLEFIEAYVTRQSRRIQAGQTLTYGWTTLRFSPESAPLLSGESKHLIVHELRDPFAFDDTAYVPGVEQAIMLLETQERALQRNHITGVAEHPHRLHSIIVCTEVVRSRGALAEPIVLERTERVEPRDSGWVLRCMSQAHSHDDPANLQNVHLLHIVTLYPATFAYVAMPIGTAVMLSDHEVVVFPPGQDSGAPDPAAV